MFDALSLVVEQPDEVIDLVKHIEARQQWDPVRSLRSLIFCILCLLVFIDFCVVCLLRSLVVVRCLRAGFVVVCSVSSFGLFVVVYSTQNHIV